MNALQRYADLSQRHRQGIWLRSPHPYKQQPLNHEAGLITVTTVTTGHFLDA